MKLFSETMTILSIIVCATAFISGCSKKQMDAPAIDAKNMDTTVKPGVDFYQYANGGWMKNNPIPAEFSRYGAFEQLEESNTTKLKDLFDNAASKKSRKRYNSAENR